MSNAITSAMRRIFLANDINPICWSECLSQRYKKLRGPEAGDRVQQPPHIKANRADGSGVADPKSHGVAVTAHKTTEADAVINVATVIKSHSAQVPHNRQGKAQFRVEDEQSVSTHRHMNIAARREHVGGAADGHNALRSGAIYGKSTKRVGAAGEEAFAGGNAAAGEGLGHAELETRGPDIFLIGNVNSAAGEQPPEVYIGPQGRGIQADIDGVPHAPMGIQRLVAFVVNERSGNRREAHGAVLGQ